LTAQRLRAGRSGIRSVVGESCSLADIAGICGRCEADATARPQRSQSAMSAQHMGRATAPSRARLALPLIGAAWLAGCASVSTDGGFAPVQQNAKERLCKDLQWPRTGADRDTVDKRVAELLAAPLTVDAAVQVALLNNRGLRAGFQELGITEAERVQARRLRTRV
jgi:hypothetical protein